LGFVQAHDEPVPSNTLQPRTLDCIYLRPAANNVQGGHEVHNLATKRVITRRKLTLLPVSTAVITAVEAIARSEGQSGLQLTSHGGHLIYDSALIAGVGEDDDTYQDDVYQDDDEHQDTDDTYHDANNKKAEIVTTRRQSTPNQKSRTTTTIKQKLTTNQMSKTRTTKKITSLIRSKAVTVTSMTTTISRNMKSQAESQVSEDPSGFGTHLQHTSPPSKGNHTT
jgi:hypothetical protein